MKMLTMDKETSIYGVVLYSTGKRWCSIENGWILRKAEWVAETEIDDTMSLWT